MAGDMAQVVEHFPRKNKALSSNNSTIPLKLDVFFICEYDVSYKGDKSLHSSLGSQKSIWLWKKLKTKVKIHGSFHYCKVIQVSLDTEETIDLKKWCEF
jgi:hypothetical protein